MATSAQEPSDTNAAAFNSLLKEGQASASPRPMLLPSFSKLAAISDNKPEEENDRENTVGEGHPEEFDTTGKQDSAQINGNLTPKCAKVLETAEVAEHILNYLSERDIVRCMRVNRGFKNIIRGSIKLQRRVFLAADHTPVVGLSLDRNLLGAKRPGSLAVNGGRDGILRSNRLLLSNLLIFASGNYRRSNEAQLLQLNLSINRCVKTYRSKPIPALGSLGEMLITRPLIKRTQTRFGDDYYAGRLFSVSSMRNLEVEGGVKVKHMVVSLNEFVQAANLLGSNINTAPRNGCMFVRLRDSYEVVDPNAWSFDTSSAPDDGADGR
ncbi:unnamed protein product [Zymoseptoria tritici ST99CH_1E4]|uniref:F-box domain-containing protein n=1 Tax=Zymoseptoria tritici ST99CH_1E4 TaxID=1276532 RepID=A0A2H1GQ14_ZYMTR|nr:unnamed protein product [Zymoseptoria tritici ST99CH_1E4]